MWQVYIILEMELGVSNPFMLRLKNWDSENVNVPEQQ